MGFQLQQNGLSFQLQQGKDLLTKYNTQTSLLVEPKHSNWLTTGSSTSNSSRENKSHYLLAKETHYDGVSRRNTIRFKLNFLGRFGESDKRGKGLKRFLLDEFGSYQTHFERPKLKEIQSPNLTFLDTVCEQVEEKESDVDEDPIWPSGGLIEEESSEQKMRLTQDLGLDSSQLSEFVEEEDMSQSSDSEEDLGDSLQDKKETLAVFNALTMCFTISSLIQPWKQGQRWMRYLLSHII